MIWLCHPCYAWVGVHKGTDEPLGRLADSELRYWKRRAHAEFDSRWRRKEKRTRRAAYEWLAEEMGLPLEQTHIGMFDVEQCKKAIKICKEAKRHEQLQKVQQPEGPAAPQPQQTYQRPIIPAPPIPERQERAKM